MGIISFFKHLFNSAEIGQQTTNSIGIEENKNQDTLNLGVNTFNEANDNFTPNDASVKDGHNNIITGDDTQDKDDTRSENNNTAKAYNLIILDESGSMSGVRSQTISGCNETLNSIRVSAEEHANIEQFVSIFCFDTTNSRYLLKNVPISEAKDLSPDDYCPNACTPLYDAIGYTVSQLRKLTTSSDTVAMVTIITDGYENASRKWTHNAIVELINSLKKKGWTFTFIGANIDVERTAKGLGIQSFMQFEQTDEGMSDMFEQERRSRRAYYNKQSYLRGHRFFNMMADEDEKEQALGAMNDNYFTDAERVAPDHITQLRDDEIFVFGSNVEGMHNGSASLYALEHFGAVMGNAEGIQGQSYAIPTVGNSFEDLKHAVERFTDYAVQHPKQKFFMTAVGCGNAGYHVGQIAPLFAQAYSFGNVYISR